MHLTWLKVGGALNRGPRDILARYRASFRVKIVGKNFMDSSAHVCGDLHVY